MISFATVLLEIYFKGKYKEAIGRRKRRERGEGWVTGKHLGASGAPGTRNRKTRTGRDTVPLDNSTKKTF